MSEEKKGLHIVFLAYRDWAMPILETVRTHPNVGTLRFCMSNEDYCGYMWEHHHDVDLVMYCGWSTEPEEHWVKKVLHVGLHCAESDRYSAGTPLQNQIIDGLKETKHRVFRVWHPELSLREWSHETIIDLRGGIGEVLEQLTVTGKLLFNQFLDDYPEIRWRRWPQIDEKNWRPKRTPKDSAVQLRDLHLRTTEDLYNHFRCLEDPYPNGYIEDEHGRLYIEKVRFERK